MSLTLSNNSLSAVEVSNIKLRMSYKEPILQWLRFSESSFTGSSEDVRQTEPAWRTVLCYSYNDIPQTISVQKFMMLVDTENQTVYWPKINTVEYLIKNDNDQTQWTFLPEYIEVDDCLVNLIEDKSDHQRSITLFIEDKPQSNFCSDVFECKMNWIDNVAYVMVHADIPVRLTWHVKNYGVWSRYVQTELKSGVHAISITPPLGDLVFLHIEGFGQYRYVHRINVVGTAGVSSGRLLWHRNMMYYPYGLRKIFWESIIIPVFHLSDIEKFKHRLNIQIQWWVPRSSWYEEAVAMIKDMYPHSSICTLGNLGEKADIIVLRPFELSEHLDSSQTYACSLFENSSNPDFGHLIGWTMEKLLDPRLHNIRFIENSWRAPVAPTRAHDGRARYGIGYSFTPGHEHEVLWTKALRNIRYRDERELLPCSSCLHKKECIQMLPTAYNSDGVVLPWNGNTTNCPLPLWIDSIRT